MKYRIMLIIALMLLSMTAAPALINKAAAFETPKADTYTDDAEAAPEDPGGGYDDGEDIADGGGQWEFEGDQNQPEEAPSHPDDSIDDGAFDDGE